MTIQERIAELEEKLRALNLNQNQLRNETLMIQLELQELKLSIGKNLQTDPKKEPLQNTPPAAATVKPIPWSIPRRPVASISSWQKLLSENKMEDLVGTNIINKVGILVTVIGVFIGAKYAIDRDLISPAMRVILGYAIAITLFVIAYRLRSKYNNYSAVLMSGAVSIAYFITLIAYSFYQLMPQSVAFILMFLITIFSVWIALLYDQKVIALLGQVGGYGIPFLLGNGYDSSELFAFLSIINIGLLYLSFRKDWKIIYYAAFCISWLIFMFHLPWRNIKTFFWIDTAFLTLNFFIFYAAFLGYKLIKKENYKLAEIAILLANAYFFFLLGYHSINKTFDNIQYLVYFTLANAVVHFAIAAWVHRIRLIDNSVFLFILGLAISFSTISIPLAFDGNATTVFWAIEAFALSYIGYKTAKGYYLNLALAVLVVTVLSLMMDWGGQYGRSGPGPLYTTTPFVNVNFWSSLFVVGSIGFICYMAIRNIGRIQNQASEILFKGVPYGFISLLYLLLCLEINKWVYFYFERSLGSHTDQLALIVLLIYSMLYVSLWLYFNYNNLKNRDLAIAGVLVGSIVFFVLLTGGLNSIGDLRRYYLANSNGPAGILLGIRYVVIASAAILMYGIRENLKISSATFFSSKPYPYLFNIVLLAFVCNEFIHWMDIGGYPDQYKLGLSIICGLYAFAMVAAGIMRGQRNIRIAGIFLLSCTLAKVMFYDLASLSTVSKTIVLIILGAIMLAASFLYNKYKHEIFSDTDPKEPQA